MKCPACQNESLEEDYLRQSCGCLICRLCLDVARCCADHLKDVLRNPYKPTYDPFGRH